MLSLHAAAAAGDLARVEELLDTGMDINSLSQRDGETPLLAALKANQPQVAALLLDRGADVRRAGAGGDTPLVHAAGWGHPDLVARIIGLGADVRARDAYGRFPLHWAAERNQIESARLLVPGPAVVNAPDNRGNAPLDLALKSGSQEMALFLLDAGARFADTPEATNVRVDDCVKKRWFDVIDRAIAQTAKAPKNRQAMLDRGYSSALALGDTEFAKFLADRGADTSTPTLSGDPALFAAAESGRAPYVKALLEQRENPKLTLRYSAWTPLHAAALQKSPEIIRLLLAKGAELNAVDALGRTPLHVAAATGNSVTVAALLAAGADPARVDAYGDSALHAAVASGNRACVQALVKARAPQAPNHRGETPVDIAKRTAHPELLDFLRASAPTPPGYQELLAILAAGRAPEAIAEVREHLDALVSHHTPLIHVAIEAGSLQLVQQLANQDRTLLATRDPAGNLPIHAAAACPNRAILEELLARGAPVNDQKNFARWTPLHFAAASGRVPFVKLLLSKGADPKLLDGQGKSPKAVAQLLNLPDVVAALP